MDGRWLVLVLWFSARALTMWRWPHRDRFHRTQLGGERRTQAFESALVGQSEFFEGPSSHMPSAGATSALPAPTAARPVHVRAMVRSRRSRGTGGLFLGRIRPVCSLVSPCHIGASPPSVRRTTFTTDCWVIRSALSDRTSPDHTCGWTSSPPSLDPSASPQLRSCCWIGQPWHRPAPSPID